MNCWRGAGLADIQRTPTRDSLRRHALISCHKLT
jgi:hypothetical protein